MSKAIKEALDGPEVKKVQIVDDYKINFDREVKHEDIVAIFHALAPSFSYLKEMEVPEKVMKLYEKGILIKSSRKLGETQELKKN